MKIPMLIIAALVIAILAVTFSLQNPATVEIKFLFWRFEGTLALILLITFAAGFIASTFLSFYALIRQRMKLRHSAGPLDRESSSGSLDEPLDEPKKPSPF